MRVKFYVLNRMLDRPNVQNTLYLLESPQPFGYDHMCTWYDSEVTGYVYDILSNMDYIENLTIIDEEAELAKWKLNMKTREVECSPLRTGKVLELGTAIEQMITEQVNKILNSEQYQQQLVNTIYSVLLNTEHLQSEHPAIQPTEQQRED